MKTSTHSFLKAVGTMALVGVLLLFSSCTEEIASENLHAVEAKGKKARPLKAQVNFVFDFQNTAPQNIVPCPGTPPPAEGENPIALFQTVVSGNMSHLGNLQPGTAFDDENNIPLSGSYLVPQSCDATTTFPVLVSNYSSFYVAANGDTLYASEDVWIDFSTGTFMGTAVIMGGTGRFADASGSWELTNGTFDGVGASWEIIGEITY